MSLNCDTVVEHIPAVRPSEIELARRYLVGDMWRDDTAAAALQKILNSGVISVNNTGSTEFFCNDAKRISACDCAEMYFTGTVLEINRSNLNRQDYVYYGCDIFTERNLPMFLRKGVGAPSALSLVDIVINGIPYPKGSILRIDTKSEVVDHQIPTPASESRRQLDKREIAKIAFIRLSIWAFPPDERSDELISLFANMDKYTDKGWDLVTKTSIDEIRAAVQLSIMPGVIEDTTGSKS